MEAVDHAEHASCCAVARLPGKLEAGSRCIGPAKAGHYVLFATYLFCVFSHVSSFPLGATEVPPYQRASLSWCPSVFFFVLFVVFVAAGAFGVTLARFFECTANIAPW